MDFKAVIYHLFTNIVLKKKHQKKNWAQYLDAHTDSMDIQGILFVDGLCASIVLSSKTLL